MNLPIYNCIIDENTENETGISAISFVDYPANEVDFIALNKQQEQIYLNRDPYKQILTGVVLKPGQLIYRQNTELGEHYIRFSEQEIEKIAQKMMRTGIALYNTTHQHKQALSGNYLTELWIVQDPQTDKSKALGFEDLPKGTLMCSYKVENKDYWNTEVMTGHVKGFSLEGFFNQQPDTSNTKNKTDEKMNKKKPKTTLLQRIARILLDIETVKKADSTDSGTPYVIFVLADGKEAFVDQDGFTTLDGQQMPGGDHKLANGSLLVVDKEGQFVETREAVTDITNPDEAKAPETLANQKAQPTDSLKAKIAEMQETINQLTKSLEEAQEMLTSSKSEVEEMRKKTPSVQPAVHLSANLHDSKNMTAAERMAIALNQTINRKK